MILACADNAANVWSAVGIILGAAIAYAGYVIGRKA